MYGHDLLLFRLFDFELRADPSWFIFVFLVTFSLVIGAFPQFYPGLDLKAYALIGAVGICGLVASIVIHEFCHSIVGRHYGVPIHDVTLFLFAGVAHFEKEPPNPTSEFIMAVAGPLVSVALGFFFSGLHVFGASLGWGNFILGVLAYLMQVNFLLAIFNLFPAFPLDGGRVLRAALWGLRGDLRWATRVVSNVGRVFGVSLMILGTAQFFVLHHLGGFWLVFLGFLLQKVSQTSYHEVLIKRALHGRRVEQFMDIDPVIAPPTMTIAEFIRFFIQRKEASIIPVAERGRLYGFVHLQELLEVPERQWDQIKILSMVHSDISKFSVSADADAERALQGMNQKGQRELLVVKDHRLLGVLSLKSLTRFLALSPARAA